MTGRARPYRFGPRDRQGFVLGIRSGQVVLVAIVLLLSVGELHSVHGTLRIPLVCAELLFGLAAAFVPVRGRTVEEWAPVVVRYGSAALSGGHRRVRLPAAAALGSAGVFSGLSLVGVSAAGGPEIGAVHDRRFGTLTGVLSVGGESFALLDDEERDRRVAAWAAVLAAVGNGASPPHRLQWIQRTVPDRRSAIRQRAERATASLAASEPVEMARRSYAAFVDAEASGVLRHETFLVLSVRTGRSRGPRRNSSTAAPSPGGADEELVRALTALRRRCVDAGIAVDGALTPEGLRVALRRSFERDDTASSSLPWPVGCEETWSAVRTDGTWHTTFWVAEWPRSEVGSDFLLPLLLGSDERRAVSIVMAPVETRKAVHRAERARTTARADSELLRRHGFARTAQSAKQHESVERREEELASGHAGYRFSGYLLVTGESEEDLERACARVEQAGAVCRLELYRLYGAQSEALLFGLPIGRGCP